MKIVIHLNHDINRTFLLEVNQGTSIKNVQEILAANKPDAAIARLINRCHVIRELSGAEKREAEFSADFLVSDDFILERLA